MHTDYFWDENTAASCKYDFNAIIARLDKNVNKCILDYGCGNGSIGKELIRLGYEVFGVDSSKVGIDIANKNLNARHFYLHDFDEGVLPAEIASQKFDTVISTQVIEHVYSPQQYVNNIKTILPRGGQLYITTPYHGYFKNLIMAITGKMDSHFTALWEGGHIKFFSRKTLSKLLEQNGFRVVSFTGMERIPYLWKSMLIVAEKK